MPTGWRKTRTRTAFRRWRFTATRARTPAPRLWPNYQGRQPAGAGNHRHRRARAGYRPAAASGQFPANVAELRCTASVALAAPTQPAPRYRWSITTKSSCSAVSKPDQEIDFRVLTARRFRAAKPQVRYRRCPKEQNARRCAASRGQPRRTQGRARQQGLQRQSRRGQPASAPKPKPATSASGAEPESQQSGQRRPAAKAEAQQGPNRLCPAAPRGEISSNRAPGQQQMRGSSAANRYVTMRQTLGGNRARNSATVAGSQRQPRLRSARQPWLRRRQPQQHADRQPPQPGSQRPGSASHLRSDD